MFGIHFGSGRPQAPVAGNSSIPKVDVPAFPGAQLPKAPPAQAKLNPWDKQHLSATLAQISKGFTSSNNFFGGLSAAAGNVSDQTDAWRKAALGSTEVGGPDSSFEIHTDENGNRTYTPITEVQGYLNDKAEREARVRNAPKPGDSQTWLGDAAYAVSQLPENQRAGAWQLAIQQGHAAGYDVTEAPPEWSPTFASYATNRNIGARQGSANAATAAYRAAADADRDRAFAASNGFRAQANARANAAAGRAAESHSRSMRSAPPSKRRGNSDLDYLR